MTDGKQAGDASIQHARIVQASVMDEKFILLNFSNGSSALVPSEEVRRLVATTGAKVVHESEISD